MKEWIRHGVRWMALAGALGVLAGVVGCGRQAAYPLSDRVIQVDSAERFNALAASEGVVLFDFYADWCGPCRALKPTIHELADQYAGRVTVAAVNVDKLRAVAESQRISSIPDVRVYRDGQPVEKLIGLMPKAAYEGAIAKALAR